MGYTCFDVSESDGVAHIRLNRPEQLNTKGCLDCGLASGDPHQNTVCFHVRGETHGNSRLRRIRWLGMSNAG